MKGLTVHIIVKNEEQWIWYAINSVIDWVDKIIIFDTGSNDNTTKLIKSIKSNKIDLTELGEIAPKKIVDLRNKQIEQTQTDWFMILDGDEVWPEVSIKEMLIKIKQSGKSINAMVVPTILPVGDLFHYQPENAGKYNILNRVGHLNIRCYRKVLGYHWRGIYPLEAYTDEKGNPIQQKPNELVLLINKYWHLTHLRRSKYSHGKFKYEIGEKLNLILPEVFYREKPSIVPSPWIKYSFFQLLIAIILTPILSLKRTLVYE